MKTIHLNFCKVPKECTCYGKYWTELLAQYQNQDYQEVLDLELMKDEGYISSEYINSKVYSKAEQLRHENELKTERNNFRKRLRYAIAEKKGKV